MQIFKKNDDIWTERWAIEDECCQYFHSPLTLLIQNYFGSTHYTKGTVDLAQHPPPPTPLLSHQPLIVQTSNFRSTPQSI